MKITASAAGSTWKKCIGVSADGCNGVVINVAKSFFAFVIAP
jgi:hypothetical protein